MIAGPDIYWHRGAGPMPDLAGLNISIRSASAARVSKRSAAAVLSTPEKANKRRTPFPKPAQTCSPKQQRRGRKSALMYRSQRVRTEVRAHVPAAEGANGSPRSGTSRRERILPSASPSRPFEQPRGEVSAVSRRPLLGRDSRNSTAGWAKKKDRGNSFQLEQNGFPYCYRFQKGVRMQRFLVLFLLSALLATAQQFSKGNWRTDTSKKSIDLNDLKLGGPPKDGIRAIQEPKFVSLKDAASWVGGGEPLIVVELDGEARAYPLQVLLWHEDGVRPNRRRASFGDLLSSMQQLDRVRPASRWEGV